MSRECTEGIFPHSIKEYLTLNNLYIYFKEKRERGSSDDKTCKYIIIIF